MLFGTSDPVRVKTGTTSPIYIPRTAGPVQVNPGDYFWIKVHSAQAAFRGSFFEQIKQLVVTSKVNLNHPLLGNEDFHAIQRSREVKKNRAEQLGLSSNLVSLVPATMSHVSISIEFIIDKENSLAKMGNLVNDDSFLAAVSLAPGAVAVAKTVGGLAQKIIQTFIPAEQRQPILQFAGDFDVGGTAGASSLQDGYYAILGSRDEENPLPEPHSPARGPRFRPARRRQRAEQPFLRGPGCHPRTGANPRAERRGIVGSEAAGGRGPGPGGCG